MPHPAFVPANPAPNKKTRHKEIMNDFAVHPSYVPGVPGYTWVGIYSALIKKTRSEVHLYIRPGRLKAAHPALRHLSPTISTLKLVPSTKNLVPGSSAHSETR
jgi:hypothetical protein